MNFLSPWAIWFLAAAPLIVALYFLRLRRRSITVSTHLFWQRALHETPRRAFFQRLRHLLSLLLHLVILLLLVGALAKPVLDRFVRDGSSVVLVLDARARMQAAGAFEKATALAREHAREAGGLRQFALITLDPHPAVAVPFTADEKPLLDALAAVTPSDAGGELEPALALAEQLLAARKGDRRIIVLTDRVVSSRTTPMTVHALGKAAPNVAITRFATRPLPASPDTAEVLLEVQNFSDTAAKTNVELAYDGRALDVKPFTLGPGERRLETFPVLPRGLRNARGWLTARLDGGDALAVDDTAFAALPPARARRVMLVSRGNFFLERMLAADASVKFELIAPDAWSPAFAGKFAAVIFDGFVPPAFDLAKVDGNFLFIKSTPFAAAAPPLEQPLVSDLDAAHPVARNVSLQNVAIARADALALPAAADGWTFVAPLRSFDRPLLIAGERGQQRVAALAFDIAESDLPLRVAFPILMSNTLHWLAGTSSENATSAVAGESLELPADQKIALTPLTAWTRDTKPPEPVQSGVFQPRKVGFFQTTDADGPGWLAVNAFAPAESDLRAAGGESRAAAASASPLAGLPAWQWLALAAFALLIVEWWAHHRRRTE